MIKNIILLSITLFLSDPQLAMASADSSWEKSKDGYYGTWDNATTGSHESNSGSLPLVSHCGFKITWTNKTSGSFNAETARNQTNGGDCDYVLLKYQCAGTSCLSRNSNPIDLLPDGTFVFYSYKYNLPMKYTYYGTEDQSKNLFMGFGTVGVWNGMACSTLACPEAHTQALQKATTDCQSAGFKECKEIWYQQIDWYNTPSIGLGAHYFSTVRGL